ncbi:hypothetical protein QC762_0068880 [Podospora pseudocomata]|uniref:Uncharacterized protein n=1 Tax=Podospora pseudocomata TaxID=2093779 RepID=A0ABR0GG74_9PEZI|nr:hypothetical protein QC762_0068880 [Podospora pseudocomata]
MVLQQLGPALDISVDNGELITSSLTIIISDLSPNPSWRRAWVLSSMVHHSSQALTHMAQSHLTVGYLCRYVHYLGFLVINQGGLLVQSRSDRAGYVGGVV